MTLDLPADLEPHLTNKVEWPDTAGVYCLLLERPADPVAALRDHYETPPPWAERFVTAATVAYVGSSHNVLQRLEQHRDGDVKRVGLLEICDIRGVHGVWWLPGEERDVLEREERRYARLLSRERPSWFVHQR